MNSSLDLLGTIKVPMNLNMLSNRLPKANYKGPKLMRKQGMLGQINSMKELSLSKDSNFE